MLGHFLNAIRRVVGDDDAGFRGGIQIDGVHSDSVPGNDFAAGHPRHDFGGEGAAVGIEQGVAVCRLRKEGFGIGHLEWNQVGKPVENFALDVQRLPHIVGQDDFCLHLHIGLFLYFSHFGEWKQAPFYF